MRDVLDLGQRAAGQSHEGRVNVRLLQRIAHLRLGGAGAQRHVNRFKDPAIERHQVWNERNRGLQLLLDLCRMSVREHTVGGNAAVVLAEMRPLARYLARAGDARLRVNDDGTLDEAGRRQRLERQERGGRIAARARHEPRIANKVRVQLRERIYDPRRQRARSRIPALALGLVTDSECAREVDHADVALQQCGADSAERFRQRQEDDVGVGGQRSTSGGAMAPSRCAPAPASAAAHW